MQCSDIPRPNFSKAILSEFDVLASVSWHDECADCKTVSDY